MSRDDLPGLADAADQLALDNDFSGVVRVDRDSETVLAKAYGLANRALGIPNTVDTRFATASATKTLTAIAVMSLVEEGVLSLSTTARSVLGSDLPLIDDDVTVEQLLSHCSGIGDYLDEDLIPEHLDDFTTYPMPIAVNLLVNTEDFVPILDGFPMKFAPGTDFAYCNGGFMVLAIIAERVSGTPYHDLVRTRVCEPAGLTDTEFLRSDELPDRVALGYLAPDGLRTNIFHLPVRGNGDGGHYTTVDDVHRLWRAFFAGDIVSLESVEAMTSPHTDDVDDSPMRYGFGFWLRPSGAVQMEGADIGVSFRSVCDRQAGYTCTVISNASDAVWPVSRGLIERLER